MSRIPCLKEGPKKGGINEGTQIKQRPAPPPAMMKRSCKACPFADTPEAIQAENLGCLPTRWDVGQMKRDHNINWVCHADEAKLCAGFIDWCRENGFNPHDGPRASYDSWYHSGNPIPGGG